LKPALARGRLRTIAATTYAEYRQYFEKDPALTRRFQTVDVGEPETDKAVSMIRSVAPMMEDHHQVVVLDEAVEAAVKLSQRYVPPPVARQGREPAGYGLRPRRRVAARDARAGGGSHAQARVARSRTGHRRTRSRWAICLRRQTAQAGGSNCRGEARSGGITAKWDAEKAALEGVVAARNALCPKRALRQAKGARRLPMKRR
jgi:type VI secretion system protein VasG